LHTELPVLLDALGPRAGSVSRIIYDETRWAPAALRMEFRNRSVILEGSRTESTHRLSLIGERFGRLDLLIVPPHTDPTRAYTAVMKASDPADVSSADELLGIQTREAQDRRLAQLAHQRWESEGGALRGEVQHADR
jgi:hypothetical protein